MKILFRFGAVAMIPLTYMLPSSVFIYFLTQGAFSVTQTIAMRNPAVRYCQMLPLRFAQKTYEFIIDTFGNVIDTSAMMINLSALLTYCLRNG